MFHIVICDDCPYQIKTILCLLEAYQMDRHQIHIQPHCFNSGAELLASLDKGNTYDLLLLDILMPGRNGIELAHDIRARDADIPLVFLTSSKDYALDAFGVSANQYLLKPIKINELAAILDKISETQNRAEKQYFMLSTPEHIVKMPFASIISVELSGRVIKIYQKNGKILTSKSIRSRFADVVAPILEDSRFICPHNSFVINMAFVEELTADSFVMRFGKHVPIPRQKYAKVKERYFAWLAEHGIGIMGSRWKTAPYGFPG